MCMTSWHWSHVKPLPTRYQFCLSLTGILAIDGNAEMGMVTALPSSSVTCMRPRFGKLIPFMRGVTFQYPSVLFILVVNFDDFYCFSFFEVVPLFQEFFPVFSGNSGGLFGLFGCQVPVIGYDYFRLEPYF